MIGGCDLLPCSETVVTFAAPAVLSRRGCLRTRIRRRAAGRLVVRRAGRGSRAKGRSGSGDAPEPRRRPSRPRAGLPHRLPTGRRRRRPGARHPGTRPRTWLRRSSSPSGAPRCRPASRWGGCRSPPRTRALNHLRSGRRRASREDAAGTATRLAPNVADAVVTLDERRRVRAALARLPRRQAVALVLRHSGLSYAEVAVALDLSPGSVGTTVRRAESALRKELIRHASSD